MQRSEYIAEGNGILFGLKSLFATLRGKVHVSIPHQCKLLCNAAVDLHVQCYNVIMPNHYPTTLYCISWCYCFSSIWWLSLGRIIIVGCASPAADVHFRRHFGLLLQQELTYSIEAGTSYCTARLPFRWLRSRKLRGVPSVGISSGRRRYPGTSYMELVW